MLDKLNFVWRVPDGEQPCLKQEKRQRSELEVKPAEKLTQKQEIRKQGMASAFQRHRMKTAKAGDITAGMLVEIFRNYPEFDKHVCSMIATNLADLDCPGDKWMSPEDKFTVKKMSPEDKLIVSMHPWLIPGRRCFCRESDSPATVVAIDWKWKLLWKEPEMPHPPTELWLGKDGKPKYLWQVHPIKGVSENSDFRDLLNNFNQRPRDGGDAAKCISELVDDATVTVRYDGYSKLYRYKWDEIQERKEHWEKCKDHEEKKRKRMRTNRWGSFVEHGEITDDIMD